MFNNERKSMKTLFAVAALLFAVTAEAQTAVQCAPVQVGQPKCKVTFQVPVDPNVQMFMLIPDVGAPVSIGLPPKTTNATTGMDTYTADLPLTIVPVGNTPHTVKVQSCQGTTAVNAHDCATASAAAPEPFTSGLAVPVNPHIAVGP